MIKRTIAIAAALAFVPLFSAQADDVGGEEIVVPPMVKEEVVVIEEQAVSLPPPGITRENQPQLDAEQSSGSEDARSR